MAELQSGAIFAGHRIEGIAGRGGFGVVYRATHLALDHVVALKLISSGRAGDETFRDRFKSESRIAVSIRHPNVVGVHHAGEEDGLLFVTMDFIEGTDLRGLLNREGRLQPEQAVSIVSQVAAALDAAHEKGLVHRDIKPGNVLIDEGGQHVYLTDFGLSKQMDATSGVTASGAFVGTLDYVAPEQIKGDRLDARTDVYALGCVMFELLSGQVPFAGQEEKVAKIYAHLQEQPPELVDAAPEVPPALSEVVWRSMAKEPDARHPSAGDFARAAAAALVGRQPSEPERNVGIGAAAPTQAFDVLAAAVAGADPGTAEAAPPETAESAPPETAEVPPPQPPGQAETREAATPATPGETVAVPPPQRPADPSTVPDAPAPAAKKGGRGRLVAALLVAAALAGGAYLALGRGGDAGNQGGGGGGGGEPSGLEEGVVADVAAKPVGIAIGGGDVWVSSRNGQELARLDAKTGEQQGDPIQLPGDGEQVAIAPDGDVWVAVGTSEGEAGMVLHLDADGNEITRTTVGIEPRGIALGDEFAWVANLGSNTVSQIDLGSGDEVAQVPVGLEPARLAAGDENAPGIWVSNSADNTVSRITDQGATVSAPITGVGATPRGVVVAGGSVWVAAQDDDRLARINPDTETVEDTIQVGDEPRTIAFGFDSLWITNGSSGSVSRVDPGNLDVEDIPDVGPDPEGIATDQSGVWVTSGGANDSEPGTVFFIKR